MPAAPVDEPTLASLGMGVHAFRVVTESQAIAFLKRLNSGLAEQTVYVTRKAAQEAVDELGLDRTYIFEVLAELCAADFDHTTPSTAVAGDLVWVFTPNTRR